jgi:FKBP-type peptidyl-prolyl cis-trans isomerase
MSQSTRSARAQRRASKIRNQRIFLVVIGVLLLAAISYMIYQATVKNDANVNSVTQNEAGLIIEDLEQGSGPQVQSGDTVEVHYTGKLTDGTKFDSSLDRNRPYQFTLGAGQVIAGWDQGVAGMQVGGKRRLTIPPELAYGAQGIEGIIPPDATLVFEVELLGIK